jgi:hypothetical protein
VALGSFMNLEVESKTEDVISEAIATARFLGSEAAPKVGNTISMDIGGSTTDIAIWHSKRVRTEQGDRPRAVLGAQESVKMAAGSVGRYLQSDPNAGKFLEWFVQAVKKQGVFQDLSLDNFAGRRHGYALMFYNILSYYELAGSRLEREYNALLRLIKGQDEARGLLLHLIYLFGSLIYYAGLLTRKVGSQEQKGQKEQKEQRLPIYHLYFCGKGGTLITWIDNYQRFAEKLFLAGLDGPDAAAKTDDSEKPAKAVVEVRISPKPKEEVGRGLLVPLTRRSDDEDEDSFGLINPKQHPVTVGETGYRVREGDTTKELSWKDKLDRSVLRNLSGDLPAFQDLKELNCFISAIREAYKYQDEDNPLYDFKGFLSSVRGQSIYIDSLTSRLLGDNEGSVLHDLEQENDVNALVEPLLITEMKVLLEVLSNNDRLFK